MTVNVDDSDGEGSSIEQPELKTAHNEGLAKDEISKITLTWRRSPPVSRRFTVAYFSSLLLYLALVLIVMGPLGLSDYLLDKTQDLFSIMFGAGHETGAVMADAVIFIIFMALSMLGHAQLFFGRRLREQKREREQLRERERKEQGSPHAANSAN